MLRPIVLLASFIFSLACSLACQAGASQRPETGFGNSVRAAAEPDASPLVLESDLVLELDRAIAALRRGLKENWETRDRYLAAFQKTSSKDRAGRSMTNAKTYVDCLLGAHLRTHQVWDEGSPIEVEVRQTIIEFTELRNEAEQARTAEVRYPNSEGQANAFQRPPCDFPTRKVAVSAGVAASMLETRIEPAYPAEALKNGVSGTVVLDATISSGGRVETLRVISGPPLLQPAALEAVRQWTYRPYLLNNMPVEVETTVNIVFSAGH